MNINKILTIIAVSLVPFVVISFVPNDKTNFIMEDKEPIETYKPVKIKVLIGENIEVLDLEDYVIGVVAAEMPASFNDEALKAQAVAARSYAIYKKERSNTEYDLTNGINDQVYINIDEMRLKWGSDYDYYYDKISKAVNSTEGEILVYDDKAIEALYFSMSGGFTEDASFVFGETIDYLKPVESIYDKECTNYEVTKTFTNDELKELLSLSCSEISISDIEYDESNYTSSLEICDKTYTGIEVRSLLNLRSANFKIDITDTVNITTYGYGHGVGMSQYGANGYAKNGYTYDEILKHYYKDVEIKNIKDV